jgi:hypothetical protein
MEGEGRGEAAPSLLLACDTLIVTSALPEVDEGFSRLRRKDVQGD